MIINEDAYIAHYGTPRHSGRYPWGSGGEETNTRSKSFLDIVDDMKRQGLSDKEIADANGISLIELRAKRTVANNERRQADIAMAQRLKDKGYSNVAIGQRMGRPESSVRAMLAPGAQDRVDNLTQIADMLKRQVDEKGYIDIGSGVETHINTASQIGVSKEKLTAAVAILKEQGYVVHPLKDRQIGTGKDTQKKILAGPGKTQKDVWENRDNVKQIVEFSDDGGRTFSRIHPPIPVNPNRVKVNYKEDGGDKADGVIYVRPGVEDVSLGGSRYAQVRVQVGPGHYLKGMAMYKDDLPAGVDLVFNTNKTNTGNKLDAMKKLNDDPDFPFGSVVRQIIKDPGSSKERVSSAMNLVREEGQWKEWSQNLSSQVLSKQSPSLAKEQLAKSYDRRRKELDEINALTNPVIKKKLLEKQADAFDSAAVHLKAATLSQQDRWHVILPINSLSETQVYAPNYDNGTRVALIRYPHGGTFEIPELVVNNKHSESRRLLGDAPDAIGINHKVAQRLSGADFDGDTVLVVPNNHGKIKTSRALDGLKDFDPVSAYPGYEGMPKMSSQRKQIEMGKVSNLITDMTLRGAPNEHLARAIRHSMVVIDAEKHGLNYKQSAIDNGIAKLKEEYQGSPRAGANSLISRKKQTVRVPERRLRRVSEGGPIDPVTGRKVYVETGATRKLSDGTIVPKLEKVNRLALANDAHTLSSGTPMERIYADYSNRVKGLGNEARLLASKTEPLKYSPSAKKAYASEVASLNAKLTIAKMNRPRERQAQVIAKAKIKAIRAANPNLDGDSLKKIEFREQENARLRVGAKSDPIKITEREWAAIQAGAIHNSKLSEIIDKADLEIVRKLATPRKHILMSPAKRQRARALLASGATRAEVARALGVSLSTLDKALL